MRRQRVLTVRLPISALPNFRACNEVVDSAKVQYGVLVSKLGPGSLQVFFRV